MDADRFDGVVRSRTRLRRSAVRLTGGALAALGVTGSSAAEGKHRREKQCKHGEATCKKACCKKGETGADGACVIKEGRCQAGDDACANTGNPLCQDRSRKTICGCQTRIGGGVRCGSYVSASACGQCACDADCIKLGFPAGSSCNVFFLDGCACAAGACVIPCGVPDPF